MPDVLEPTAPFPASEIPLLQASHTLFETLLFTEIAPEHFMPAFEQAFADHAAEIAAIATIRRRRILAIPSPRWSARASCSPRCRWCSATWCWRIPTRRCLRSTRNVAADGEALGSDHDDAVLFGRIVPLQE